MTPLTVEPLSLAEAKAHLRVDITFTDDDAYISALISAARDYAEGFQNRSLGPVTLAYYLDAFPRGRKRGLNGSRFYPTYLPIRLPRTPIVTVTSVSYKTANGSTTIVPTSDYVVKADGDIIPAYGKIWPVDELTTGDAVKVTYAAGYGIGAVPPTTKQGMLLLLGNWYENRESVIIGKTVFKVPLAAEALLWMDRSW